MVGMLISTTDDVDMAEIDPTNIVPRRTRGRKIDFAKEAEAAGPDLEEDDEEDEEYVSLLTSFNSDADDGIGCAS